MVDPIRQAIDYANDDRHDGHGYTLNIYVEGSERFEAVVLECDETKYTLGYFLPEKPEVHERPVFIHPDRVRAAEVLW